MELNPHIPKPEPPVEEEKEEVQRWEEGEGSEQEVSIDAEAAWKCSVSECFSDITRRKARLSDETASIRCASCISRRWPWSGCGWCRTTGAGCPRWPRVARCNPPYAMQHAVGVSCFVPCCSFLFHRLFYGCSLFLLNLKDWSMPSRTSDLIIEHSSISIVSTLLIIVGHPYRPIKAGKGGFNRGWPLFPSILSSKAVSSPQSHFIKSVTCHPQHSSGHWAARAGEQQQKCSELGCYWPVEHQPGRRAECLRLLPAGHHRTLP